VKEQPPAWPPMAHSPHSPHSPRPAALDATDPSCSHFHYARIPPLRIDAAGYALRESHVRIRAASSDGLRSHVGALLKKRYAWRGYDSPSVAPDLMTLAAEDTATGLPIGTIGARLDSTAGLGCDGAFSDVCARLRSDGRKLSEFTALATEPGAPRQALAALFHSAYLYLTRVGGADYMLMEVNPRHKGIYTRGLGFCVLSEERVCPRAQAPALLLGQNRAYLDARIAQVAGTWREPTASEGLYAFFFNEAEAEGLCRRVFGSMMPPA
jgi:hypothetical protein